MPVGRLGIGSLLQREGDRGVERQGLACGPRARESLLAQGGPGRGNGVRLGLVFAPVVSGRQAAQRAVGRASRRVPKACRPSPTAVAPAATRFPTRARFNRWSR